MRNVGLLNSTKNFFLFLSFQISRRYNLSVSLSHAWKSIAFLPQNDLFRCREWSGNVGKITCLYCVYFLTCIGTDIMFAETIKSILLLLFFFCILSLSLNWRGKKEKAVTQFFPIVQKSRRGNPIKEIEVNLRPFRGRQVLR